MRSARSLVATTALLLVPLLAAGCGGKKKQDDSQPSQGGPSGAAPAPESPLSEDDLMAVCDGKGEPRAKAYSKTDTTLHTMTVFESGKGEGAKLQRSYLHTLNAFLPTKLEDIELVGCVRRTAEKKISTCDFDTRPPTRYLDMFEATYELTVREAKTGTALATKTVTLPPEACPMLHTFSGERDSAYPEAELLLAELAAPVLVPANPTKLDYPNVDVAREKIDDYRMDRVCVGIPEPRAAAYEKAPGKKAPTIILSRTGPTGEIKKDNHSDFNTWKADDPSQLQLVACIVETSRTKKKECKFDDKPPVHLLDLYSGTQEITIREARTAKVLGTKKITSPSDGVCPTMFFFHSEHDSDVALNEKEVLAFVRTHAEPK